MNTVPAEPGVDAEVHAVIGALAQFPVAVLNECDSRLVDARCGQKNRLRDVRSRHLGVLDPGWELSGDGAAGGRGGEREDGCQLHDECVEEGVKKVERAGG